MSDFSYPSPSSSSSIPNGRLIRFGASNASNHGRLARISLLLAVGLLCCAHVTCSADERNDVIAPLPSEQQPLRLKLSRRHPSDSSTSSELSFEHQNLKSIPSAELCSIRKQLEHINSISFAFNQLDSIASSAFTCVARRLRILNLRRNQIESIAHDAFARLDQLQVLLLDGNQLRRVPSKSFEPLASLRHLNLASNLIESIGGGRTSIDEQQQIAAPDGDQLQTRNLISLNLKANPLKRISSNAFKQLARLKTLILSETQLELRTSGDNKVNPNKLVPFEGLNELRFLHLDHLGGAGDDDAEASPANATTQLGGDFCSHSRKLTSLILRANGLAEIPQFSNCQNLLQLDLTFNRIAGSLDGHFRLQVNLIDLYLANNLIESLSERAFVGLDRLQVLNLQQNQLKFIHANAFLPLGASLIELNVAQNGQLAVLPSVGLENQLKHLRAFGNYELRSIPRLRAIESLALTYAYHCCDYLAASNGTSGGGGSDSLLAMDSGEGSSLDILMKIRQFFNYFSAATRRENGAASQGQRINLHDDEYLEHSGNLKNLSEFIVWPPSLETTTTMTGELHFQDESTIVSSSVRNRREISSPSLETAPPPPPRDELVAKSNLVPPEDGSDNELERRLRGARRASKRIDLIDELVLQLAKIRRSNLNEQMESSLGLKLNDDDERQLIEFQVATSDMIELADHDDDDDEFVPHQVGVRMARFYDKRPFSSSFPRDFRERILSRRQAANYLDRDHHQPVPGEQSNASPTNNNQNIYCQPKPNAFMPCRDLFDQWWLRTSVWLVFLFAFLGNILVIVVLTSVRANSSSALTSIMWFQAHSKRHIDVPRFLVINLAIADLLMACYLGLLVCVDLATWNKFKYFAIKWQYSSGCRVAGFLAVLSSELSVFILAIITLERNYAITNAVHLNRRLSLQKAMLIMLLGYSFALVMASLPLNGISDYRKFSICLPGLDFQSNLRSQIYLIALVSINTFSFLLLLGCYLRMYCAIRGSQAWNTNDLRIAKRMSILVLTDFLCWMPIIFVSISSLFGYYLIGPNGLKVLTVFVLPLNSVANPFLYAITTKKFKRDLVTLKRRFNLLIFSIISQCCCCGWFGNKQNPATLNDNNNDHHLRLHLNDNKLIFSRKYQGNLVAGNGGGGGGQFSKRRKSKPAVDTANDAKRLQNSRAHLDKNNRRRFKFDSNDDEEGEYPKNKLNQRQLNTNNQVTINRTTCSCGGQRGATSAATAGQLQLRDQSEPTTTSPSKPTAINNNNRRQVAIQVKLDGSSHLADPADCELSHIRHEEEDDEDDSLRKDYPVGGQLKPRIVLDVAVEPTLDVALVPLGLSCCEMAKGRLPQMMSRLICPQLSAESIDGIASNHATSIAGDQLAACDGTTLKPGGCKKQTSLQDSLLQTSSRSTQSNINQQQQQQHHHSDGDQLRPHSANSTNGLLSSHITSPNHTQHVSCQAILISNKHTAAGGEHHSLVNNNNNSGSTRSASACGYNHTRQRRQQQQPMVKNSTASESRVDQGCGTCCSTPTACPAEAGYPYQPNDCCPIRGHRSPVPKTPTCDRSSWRSINRLFSPLIKTWSSIQLSLQTATAQQLQQSNDGQCTVDGKQLLSTDENDQQTGTSTLNDEDDGDDDDDFLQLSSPARRRLLRNNERRMSRSCELISAKRAGDDDDPSDVKSSCGAEPSSSQCDYFDDQRILLATINRMAGESNRNQQIVPSRRCKRCRSWSPALLDKLEDCMYQIKSRVPNFNFGTARQSVCHEQMEPGELSESNNPPGAEEEQKRDKYGRENILIDVDGEDEDRFSSTSSDGAAADDHHGHSSAKSKAKDQTKNIINDK